MTAVTLETLDITKLVYLTCTYLKEKTKPNQTVTLRQQNTSTGIITLLPLGQSSSGMKADTVAILQKLSVCFLQIVFKNDSIKHRQDFNLKRPRILRNQYPNLEAVCFNMAKRKGYFYILAQSYVKSSVLCLHIVSRDIYHLEILQIYHVDLVYY